jgi:uncharacterized membrane protein
VASRKSVDLLAAMAVAALAAALTLLGIESILLRALVALPLVLFVPGYTIVAAAFPGRPLPGIFDEPGPSERALFSLGVSLAVTAVGTVALDLTVWGLQAASWMALLSGVTIVASLIALVRRSGVETPQRGVSTPDALEQTAPNALSPERKGQRVLPARVPNPARLNLRQGVAVGVALLVAVAAVGLATTPAPPQGTLGYSQLWLLPASDRDPNLARLGLSSSEFDVTDYSLEVTLDGTPIYQWSTITLAPGEKWEAQMQLPPSQPGQVVEALLYRHDTPGRAYRRVTLWRAAPGS